ncbi:Hint domain-containing protein [Acidisoma cellulosilytica]|uniref:Hint domain-containing protein n=1 Tax=Acidisoma cellulosilyticum TaxID=2802395 RepID=A0A963Z4S1_9PROT|nr:Hint domain-containing protein [Acidisoma cellulosilyticum]
MSDISVSDAMNAANWSYSQGSSPLPDGFTYLMENGNPVTQYDANTGFYGAALVTPAGQVIIAYEGTNLFTGDAIFTAAQAADDAAIGIGVNAPSFYTADTFAQAVLKDAKAQGYASSDVFLAGHSLGGAEAEYVATQEGLAGITFGAPGINNLLFDSPSQLTNYVEQGDPVGNYSSDAPDYLGQIVQNSLVQHYGGQVLTGPSWHSSLLTTAATAYASGGTAVSAEVLAVAVQFHLLGTYATDLGVTLDNGDETVAALMGDTNCFVAGTRLAMPDGEAAVEALRAGDLVLTADGIAQPVIWVGYRRLDCRRHPAPRQVTPVRVAAGAFGPGQPSRDLRLSPDHAILAEGVLIPIRYLINGDTIRQEAPGIITYYHIELAQHAILLAEGLPAESYLDTGTRQNFSAGRVVALHADFTPDPAFLWDSLGAAPLRVCGAEVEQVKALLAVRMQDGLQPGAALACRPRCCQVAGKGRRGQTLRMSRSHNPDRGFRFPPEIIAHAVWLYHCFSLSLGDVELILAARRNRQLREHSGLGHPFWPAIRGRSHAPSPKTR